MNFLRSKQKRVERERITTVFKSIFRYKRVSRLKLDWQRQISLRNTPYHILYIYIGAVHYIPLPGQALRSTYTWSPVFYFSLLGLILVCSFPIVKVGKKKLPSDVGKTTILFWFLIFFFFFFFFFCLSLFHSSYFFFFFFFFFFFLMLSRFEDYSIFCHTVPFFSLVR